MIAYKKMLASGVQILGQIIVLSGTMSLVLKGLDRIDVSWLRPLVFIAIGLVVLILVSLRSGKFSEVALSGLLYAIYGAFIAIITTAVASKSWGIVIGVTAAMILVGQLGRFRKP